jgi:hypothetical protein
MSVIKAEVRKESVDHQLHRNVSAQLCLAPWSPAMRPTALMSASCSGELFSLHPD